MPQITIRVTEEAYQQIQNSAAQSNLTITDFLLSKAIPSYLDEVLTVGQIITKISSIRSGETFSLPSLFTEREWNNFKPGSRISTGRRFFKAYENNEFNLKDKVKFEGKNSANLAIYKKLTDD